MRYRNQTYLQDFFSVVQWTKACEFGVLIKKPCPENGDVNRNSVSEVRDSETEKCPKTGNK